MVRDGRVKSNGRSETPLSRRGQCPIGAPFIRKLFGEMNVTMFRDSRQGPDWPAAGKFAVCFSCDVERMSSKACRCGLVRTRAFKEGGGLVQQYGTRGLMTRAPHPNAAKVFINWLLSRRGQIAMQKQVAKADSPADSLRIDIPKDDVPFQNRRLAGVKYVDTGKPEMVNMKPILKIVNEALTAAEKN